MVMKINELNNLQVSEEVEVSQTELEIEPKAEDTSKDTQEPKQEEEQKATKHVVIYLGSGEYIDSTGKKWKRNDEVTLDEEQFENRKDLQFMIKYGEMKHTVVTM